MATAAAAATSANFGAGVVIFGSHGSCSLGQKSRMVSNVLLLRRSGSKWVRSMRAPTSSPSRVIRSEASSSNGVEQEEDGALVSRRWATIALPAAVATLRSSIAFSKGEAVAEAIAIESRVAGVVAMEGRDLENGAEGGRVELRTLKGCGLGVARFPDFVYNAEGGGGAGTVQQLAPFITEL